MVINANGHNDTGADIRAAPFPSAGQKFAPDEKSAWLMPVGMKSFMLVVAA